ncbi:MAG: AraC family transcriptional regulator ligand-binding domain-containing protein [Bacteroidota bacterium]
MKYISTNLYKKMINHALAEGMSQEEVAKISLPHEAIYQANAVPADAFFELHEQIDKRLGPGFSVRVGQEMKMDDYGVLGLSWKTCSWAGEIFDRSERYFMLLSNTYVFKVEEIGEWSHVFLFRDGYRRGVELSNEATFSATVVVLRAMTESEISPVQVSFKHGPPRGLDDYEKSFQCPVLFNQEENFIAYTTEALRTRTAKADASINRFLVERVEEETRGIEISPNKIAADVEELIKDALPSGIPSVQQLGEHMGMSSRTLTRRLAECGVSFRDLVRNTQENISKDLLTNSSRNMAEIAFQIGFSEQSAFNRAFKRWTGLSPLAFRKQQTGK